jgi:hemolysin activation/secretion protein
LAIAPTADQALSLQSKQAQGVNCAGMSQSEVAALHNLLAPYIGQPISLDTLQAMARKVEKAMDPNPQRVVLATFPPQEITSGIIAMRVGVPVLTEIGITGRAYFGGDFIAETMQSSLQQPLSRQDLRDSLATLNRNPFRKASALWQEHETHPDEARLLLRVQEKRPWNFFSGIDNYASEALGNERIFVGGKFGNVGKRDHRLNWLLLSSLDADALRAGSVGYEIPLPENRTLQFSLGYTESSTQEMTSLIENNGRFLRMSGMLEMPLPDWGMIEHQWRTGFSWRANKYERGADTVDLGIFTWENHWLTSINDRWGKTEIDAELVWNPGSGFFSSDDEVYQSLGGHDADYWIASLHAKRMVPLEKWGTLALRAEVQWANQGLLASDQFSAAGQSKLRGFDEGQLFFDSAIFVSAEWRLRQQKVGKTGTWQPYGFIDAAWLRNHSESADALQSLGAGARLNWDSDYAARVECALPLNGPSDADQGAEWHFAIYRFW